MVLTYRWIHKWKDAEVNSRLVVSGFEQTADGAGTGAGTPSLVTLMVLLTIARIRNWYMATGDVRTTFLHAPLAEPVYVTPPNELRKPGLA